MRLKNLKRYWQIFWKMRQIHLMRTLEYRGDFFFWTMVSVMWTFFNFFFFDIIVNVSGQIGGWTRPEMWLLLGVFTIIDAFTWSFFFHNMRLYTQQIFTGQFSQHLVRPIDAQFMIMTFDNSYTNLFRFLIGVGICARAFHQLEIVLTMSKIISFSLLLIAALVMIYFFWFIIATTAFYVDKLENINDVIPALRRMWQVPRSIYTGVISWIITIFFPLALASSIPSEALLDRLSPGWLVYFLSMAVVVVIISRWFYHFSVRRYSGIAN